MKNYKLRIVSAVTQPPRRAGRKQEISPTPVETWAKEHNVTVLSYPTNRLKPWLYENEQDVIDSLQPFKADLVVSASYGQKIPTETIAKAKFGGLNVHPSVLPRWRGGDPVPWAILTGDHQIGVTIVSITENFDEGHIIAQKKIPTPSDALPDPLRTELFTIGADLLLQILPTLPMCHSYDTSGVSEGVSEKQPYAKRLTKNDGFEPWETILTAIEKGPDADRIERKCRAFSPWPGLWTICEGKRLKILKVHVVKKQLIIDHVQLEGKKPVPYRQFASAYLPAS